MALNHVTVRLPHRWEPTAIRYLQWEGANASQLATNVD